MYKIDWLLKKPVSHKNSRLELDWCQEWCGQDQDLPFWF